MLEKIIRKINKKSPEKINKEIKKITTEEWKKIKNESIVICYDREMCSKLRIPYQDLREKHIKKIQLYCYYEAKKKGKI